MPIPPPPGDCTKKRHSELGQIVGHFCKDNPRSCKDNTLDCNELRLRWAYNVMCRLARKTVMNECFRGGDEGHRRQLDEAANAQARCEEKMKEKGCRLPTEELDGLCR